MKPVIAQTVENAQLVLESCYRTTTGLRAEHFYSLDYSVKNFGTVVCHNTPEEDLEISVLLDRDYFSASLTSHHYSVIFEELSHLYLLSVNHQKNRSTTRLELEAQSEIDRLLCTLSLSEDNSKTVASELHAKLFYESYPDTMREKARLLAGSFLKKLSSTNPHKWRAADFKKMSDFLHADLAQKFYLARYY